ncbi:MAG: exodeoxyribonuclease I [Lautropia sp.]|nr:exodeoxyribonuclease I [Lautropia sp.]
MSETTSFFWHDYETFGRNPRMDRPAQFAGIRTDLDLREIDAPVMLHCQPAPDYLPDPGACLLTGILPQLCLHKGLPEYRFAERILAELGRSGTIGAGYNSIRFDDEVSRHLFWRTLLPPYDREWRNGCSRWDLLDVVRCAAALRPEGIEWPHYDDGRPSFRLEDLSIANHLAHEQAHDALSDVRATIALAQLIRSRQPRLWDFCLALRHKHRVLEEIGHHRPFIHISAMYGPDRGGMAVVWPLAPHPTNRNELLVWDLAFDPNLLTDLSVEQMRTRLFASRDELPPDTPRLPIRSIHVNRSPIVISNLKILNHQIIQRWQIDMAAIQRHTDIARRITARLAGHWSQVYESRPACPCTLDVDIDLYGGFISSADRRRLDEWRNRQNASAGSAAADSAQLSADSTGPDRVSPEYVPTPSFEDPRLEELSFRYRARQFPAILNAAEKQRWLTHCHARLHQGAGSTMTLASYADRLDVLNQSLSQDDEHSQRLLEALYDYGEQLA